MPPKGIIVLMGSGELTSTMAGVHRELLADWARRRGRCFSTRRPASS